MSFAAVAVVAGSAISAGGAAYGANQQKKGAKDAQKAAEEAYQQASKIFSAASQRQLQLPGFDAVDKTGKFQANQFDAFDQLGRTDASGNPMPDLINEVSRSFAQDVTNAQRSLPALEEMSQARQDAATRLYDDFLERSGLATGQQSAADAINSFLRMEMPESARRDINRRSNEVALRSGTINSGPSLDFANRQDYNQRVQNFFAALPQQQSMLFNRAQFVEPGLERRYMPAPGATLGAAQGNFNLRSQAALMNYQNELQQNITRHQQALTERLSNFERRDNFDLLRANILTNQGNASTQRANALSAGAAQSMAAGFNALGQGVMRAGGMIQQGNRWDQQQQMMRDYYGQNSNRSTPLPAPAISYTPPPLPAPAATANTWSPRPYSEPALPSGAGGINNVLFG